jgi:4'-phosphopantetheinyl transferase EntD
MSGDFYFPDLYGASSCLIVDAKKISRDADTFSPLELEYAHSRYVNEPRREEWLTGRFVLKALLRRRFGIAPRDAVILAENGRPSLLTPVQIDGRALHVSLAHKGGIFMAGSSLDGATGVDVEIRNDAPLALNAIKRACSEGELRSATSHPVLREKDFLYLAWCLKECSVKAQIARTVFATKGFASDLSERESDGDFSFFDARSFSFDRHGAKAWIHENFYAAMVTA